MQIAETIRIAMVRIISGSATGSVYIASNALASDERSTNTTTTVTETSLNSDLANSTRPCVPNSRLQPLIGEIRDKLRLDALEHQARRILQQRCGEPEHRQDDDQRHQESQRLEAHHREQVARVRRRC